MTAIESADPIAQSLLTWVAATKRGLLPSNPTASRFNEIRLKELVLSLLDLDTAEAAQVVALLDTDFPFERCPEHFYAALQQAIGRLRLSNLFARTQDGDHHRSVCPAASNERTGEHYPEEMACWRADYRAMSP